MRRGVVAHALAVLLLGVGGCGVAGETGVTRDHAAAQPGLLSDTSDFAEPRGREQSSNALEIVDNYLRAAAGEPKSAVDRVRSFLPPDVRSTYNPSPEIVVVRPIGDRVESPQGAGRRVPVRLQPVGVLTEQGTLLPPGPREQSMIEWEFVVSPGEAGQPGLFLGQPYPRLLLSTSALAPVSNGRADQETEVLYRPHLLYFWDTESRTLVPDLRYLTRWMPKAQRPTEVVHRLVAGPSAWLSSAVQPPPAGTEVRGNVVLKGDRLVVDLNAKASAPGAISPQKLLAQLRWSLWDLHKGPIILQIEGQEKASDGEPSAYIDDNPAASLTSTPDIFCIADGVVLAGCTDPAVRAAPPVLRSPENRDVVSAAVTGHGDGGYAALVRRTTANRRTLFVGRARPGDAAPAYVTTSLTAASMSRPLWLDGTDSRLQGRTGSRRQGLVAADGRLYHFDSDGKVTQLRTEVNGIEAVAAGPDARRIALIAGGAVYVAPLSAQKGALAVGGAERLGTTLGSLTAVGFSRPERLVVAGSGWLAELSVDGAIEEKFYPLGDARVSALAAHPDNPATNGSTRGAILIEVGGASYQVFASRLQPISWTGPAPPSPAPSPAPNTTAGRQPPKSITAPFFEG